MSALSAIMYREGKIRATNLTFIFWDLFYPLGYLLVFGVGMTQAMGMKPAGIGVDYNAFFLAGVLGMASFGIASNTAWSFFMDRDNGIFYEMLTYPMRRSEYLLGKGLFNLCVSIVQAIITVVLADIVLDVPVRWQALPLLAAAVFIGTAGWFFFYAIFALVIRGNDVFNTVTSIFYFVLLFASSMFYPVEPLPTPLRQLSWANPITWHVDVLRYATIGLGDPSRIWLEAAGFLAFHSSRIWRRSFCTETSVTWKGRPCISQPNSCSLLPAVRSRRFPGTARSVSSGFWGGSRAISSRGGNTWSFSSTISRSACTSCSGARSRRRSKAISVTGDYRRSWSPASRPRIRQRGDHDVGGVGEVRRRPLARESTYDFTRERHVGRMGSQGGAKKVKAFPRAEIADVLLDQAIFAGVGNIIKNEVLFRTRVSPFARVRNISPHKLKAIVADARDFSFRFLELRRGFSLRKNLEVYGRSICPRCGGKVARRIHGQRGRRSFFCAKCQRVRLSGPSTRPTPRSSTGKSNSYRPSTRWSRPDTSKKAACASVNRRASPASA